jgi:hypothetical protein
MKLLRTYTAKVEVLAKLRRGGEQTVRVEHVDVHPGGQAIVGNVTPGGGATVKTEDPPCQSPAMKHGRCRMHGGPSPGAPRGNKNAYKHGRYTAEAIARGREVSAFVRATRTWLREL